MSSGDLRSAYTILLEKAWNFMVEELGIVVRIGQKISLYISQYYN